MTRPRPLQHGLECVSGQRSFQQRQTAIATEGDEVGRFRVLESLQADRHGIMLALFRPPIAKNAMDRAQPRVVDGDWRSWPIPPARRKQRDGQGTALSRPPVADGAMDGEQRYPARPSQTARWTGAACI